MPNIAELGVKFTADHSEFDRSVQHVHQTVGELASRFGGGVLSGAGFAAGIGVMRTALEGLNASSIGLVQTFAQVQAGTVRLQQAVQNTGESWNRYAGSMKGAVDAAANFGFGAQESQRALALLTAQTGSAEEAQKRFSLAMDISRGTGLELFQVSMRLGRINEENTTALQRMGISIGKGASETEVLAAAQQKFAGQAAVFGGTLEGAFQRMNVRIEEAKVRIGAELAPSVEHLMPVMVDLVGVIERGAVALIRWVQASPVLQAVAGAIEGITGHTRAAAAAASEHAASTGAMADNLAPVHDSQRSIKEQIDAKKTAQDELNVKIDAENEKIHRINEALRGNREELRANQQAADAVRASFEAQEEPLKRSAQAIDSQLRGLKEQQDAIKSAFADIKAPIEEALRGAQDRLKDNKDAADAVKQSYTETLDPLEKQLQSLRDQVDVNRMIQDAQLKIQEITYRQALIQAEGDPIRRAQLAAKGQEINDRLREVELQKSAQDINRQIAELEQKKHDAIKAGKPFSESDYQLQIQALGLRKEHLENEQQLVGLVDKKAKAEAQAGLEQVKAKQATQEIAKTQEDLAKKLQEIPLEEQIRNLKNEEKERLGAIEAQGKQIQIEADAYREMLDNLKRGEEEALKPLRDRTEELNRQRDAIRDQLTDLQQAEQDALKPIEAQRKGLENIGAQLQVNLDKENEAKTVLEEQKRKIDEEIAALKEREAAKKDAPVTAITPGASPFAVPTGADNGAVSEFADNMAHVAENTNAAAEAGRNFGAAIREMMAPLGEHLDIVRNLVVVWGVFRGVAVVAGIIASIGAAAAGSTGFLTALGLAAGGVALAFGEGGLLAALGAIPEAILALAGPQAIVTAALAAFALAWINNWGDIQGKAGAVKDFLAGTVGPGIGGFFATLDKSRTDDTVAWGTWEEGVRSGQQTWLKNMNADIIRGTGEMAAGFKSFLDTLQKDWETSAANRTRIFDTWIADQIAKIKAGRDPIKEAAAELGQAIFDGIWDAIKDLPSKIGDIINEIMARLSRGRANNMGAAVGNAEDPQVYARRIAELSGRAGLNPDWMVAQLLHESNLDPTAINPSGARGIAQIMPTKAEELARKLGVTVEQFWNSVDLQIQGAVKLMQDLTEQFGSQERGLSGYYAGPGGGVHPEYVEAVKARLGEAMQLEAGQRGAPAGVVDPHTISQGQLVEQGLSAKEAAAACGPFAAMLFASTVGRYPTAREAVELARKVGWTPSKGMAGPASELRLLSEMGMNAVGQAATAENINTALAAGHPIAISTPQHYFEAEGGTADALNVGRTGTALPDGKPTMSLQEISNLGGGLQGIIVLLDKAGSVATVATGKIAAGMRAAVAPVQQLTAAEQAEIQRNTQWAQQQQSLTALIQRGWQGAATTQQDATRTMQAALAPLFQQVAEGSITTDALTQTLVDMGKGAGLTVPEIQAVRDGVTSTKATFTDMVGVLGETDDRFNHLNITVDSNGKVSADTVLAFMELLRTYRETPDAVQVATDATQKLADATVAGFKDIANFKLGDFLIDLLQAAEKAGIPFAHEAGLALAEWIKNGFQAGLPDLKKTVAAGAEEAASAGRDILAGVGTGATHHAGSSSHGSKSSKSSSHGSKKSSSAGTSATEHTPQDIEKARIEVERIQTVQEHLDQLDLQRDHLNSDYLAFNQQVAHLKTQIARAERGTVDDQLVVLRNEAELARINLGEIPLKARQRELEAQIKLLTEGTLAVQQARLDQETELTRLSLQEIPLKAQQRDLEVQIKQVADGTLADQQARIDLEAKGTRAKLDSLNIQLQFDQATVQGATKLSQVQINALHDQQSNAEALSKVQEDQLQIQQLTGQIATSDARKQQLALSAQLTTLDRQVQALTDQGQLTKLAGDIASIEARKQQLALTDQLNLLNEQVQSLNDQSQSIKLNNEIYANAFKQQLAGLDDIQDAHDDNLTALDDQIAAVSDLNKLYQDQEAILSTIAALNEAIATASGAAHGGGKSKHKSSRKRHRQAGGFVFPGEEYEVGEEGYELGLFGRGLLSPPAPGMILPHEASRTLVGALGHREERRHVEETHYHINASGYGARDVGELVERRMRQIDTVRRMRIRA